MFLYLHKGLCLKINMNMFVYLYSHVGNMVLDLFLVQPVCFKSVFPQFAFVSQGPHLIQNV